MDLKAFPFFEPKYTPTVIPLTNEAISEHRLHIGIAAICTEICHQYVSFRFPRSTHIRDLCSLIYLIILGHLICVLLVGLIDESRIDYRSVKGNAPIPTLSCI